MMLFGRTFTAEEACAAGLVAQVFPSEVFQQEAWAHVQKLAQLPKQVRVTPP